MIQQSKQRYSNMLWNMRSITRHKRSYGHPLHPYLTPDVLSNCVLPLGTVSSGRESEVESAHLFLTIIQFFSACHLTSQHKSTCIHNSIISHLPTHYKSPVFTSRRKHCLHKAHQDYTSSVSKKAAYNNICKTVQNRLRDMQDSWLSKKAEEVQSFADRKDMKKFHDALKTIYGSKSSSVTPLLSAYVSTLLTDKGVEKVGGTFQ